MIEYASDIETLDGLEEFLKKTLKATEKAMKFVDDMGFNAVWNELYDITFHIGDALTYIDELKGKEDKQ